MLQPGFRVGMGLVSEVSGFGWCIQARPLFQPIQAHAHSGVSFLQETPFFFFSGQQKNEAFGCFFFSGNFFFSPPDRKGLLDLMLESAFAMLLHQPPTQYPARAARQRIPPSIPPEQLVTGSCRVYYTPPELLASGSRPVSRQSGFPVDPAEYPARAAGQWIPQCTQ